MSVRDDTLPGMLRGTVLTESLRIGAALEVPGLELTSIGRRNVAGSVTDSQPDVWTFLEFAGADELADELSDALTDALRADGGWYADFTVGDDHVIAFAHRAFRYRRGDQAGRTRAVEYGRSVGVPEHQLDWGD